MARMAFWNGSLRSRTPNLSVENNKAAKAAARMGAIAQDAAIWETLPVAHPHLIGAEAAKPTPTNAPTTVCVVETGKPARVAMISHVALPASAQPIARMRTPGEGLKRSMVMMPFLMVPVTRLPRATAPTNSVIIDKKPTWGIVKVRAATEVAYELAMSLAPLPKLLTQKKMEMRAIIQSYLATLGAGILRQRYCIRQRA